MARVTKKLCDGDNYKDSRYARRLVCIYRPSGTRCVWKKNSAYHGPESISRDLGQYPDYRSANVLLSGDFRYFGIAGRTNINPDFLAAPDRSVPLILIKTNICKLLEPKLTRDGFRVLNRGCLIPFPASGQQKKFHEQFPAIIASATEG